MSTEKQSTPAAARPVGFVRPDTRPRDTRSEGGACLEAYLGEVLFEQLSYLIRFADQERDRLEQVKAILMETFN
jgi:hypothetical protein